MTIRPISANVRKSIVVMTVSALVGIGATQSQALDANTPLVAPHVEGQYADIRRYRARLPILEQERDSAIVEYGKYASETIDARVQIAYTSVRYGYPKRAHNEVLRASKAIKRNKAMTDLEKAEKWVDLAALHLFGIDDTNGYRYIGKAEKIYRKAQDKRGTAMTDFVRAQLDRKNGRPYQSFRRMERALKDLQSLDISERMQEQLLAALIVQYSQINDDLDALRHIETYNSMRPQDGIVSPAFLIQPQIYSNRIGPPPYADFSFDVTATGTLKNVTYVGGTAPMGDRRRAWAMLLNSRYLPALYDGQPIDMSRVTQRIEFLVAPTFAEGVNQFPGFTVGAGVSGISTAGNNSQ